MKLPQFLGVTVSDEGPHKPSVHLRTHRIEKRGCIFTRCQGVCHDCSQDRTRNKNFRPKPIKLTLEASQVFFGYFNHLCLHRLLTDGRRTKGRESILAQLRKFHPYSLRASNW